MKPIIPRRVFYWTWAMPQGEYMTGVLEAMKPAGGRYVFNQYRFKPDDGGRRRWVSAITTWEPLLLAQGGGS